MNANCPVGHGLRAGRVAGWRMGAGRPEAGPCRRGEDNMKDDRKENGT